jgi:hypothetical protein
MTPTPLLSDQLWCKVVSWGMLLLKLLLLSLSFRQLLMQGL